MDGLLMWIYVLLAIAVIAIFAMFRGESSFDKAQARRRAVSCCFSLDVSSIASIKPGWVRIHGVAEPFEGNFIRAEKSGTPCFWFRSRAEKSGSNSGESVSKSACVPFALVEGGGKCIIRPENAIVRRICGNSFSKGSWYVTEKLILSGEAFEVGGLAAWRPDKPGMIEIAAAYIEPLAGSETRLDD